MIRYNPTDGDVLSRVVSYRPQTCFIMTKLGGSLPQGITNMRNTFCRYAGKNGITSIDASSETTGKDFLLKIWDLICSVPLGVAIVSEELPALTLCNIYYELGVLQALGKETLIIKSENCSVPSDFVRTEYIEHGRAVGKKISGFFKTYFDQAKHYATMAEGLEQNPALAIDYLKRAFLISGDKNYQAVAKNLFQNNQFDAQRTESIKRFLQTRH